MSKRLVHYLNPKTGKEPSTCINDYMARVLSYSTEEVTCEDCKDSKEYQMGQLLTVEDVASIIRVRLKKKYALRTSQ